jgi:hypothetical protein
MLTAQSDDGIMMCLLKSTCGFNMFSHEEMNYEVFEENANKLMAFFVDGINMCQDHGNENLSLADYGSEQLADLCRRAYDLGVCGLVMEGEILHEDLGDLHRYSQLNLILGLIDEEQKLFTTLGEALSGRIKLCLHAAIPMTEIYELDMIIDAYFSECIDLTFTELAALANMSEKSVRNAFLSLKEQGVVYKIGSQQYIKVDFAREWLTHRKDYKPTKNLAGMEGLNEEYVNVPVATDGTCFSYQCEYKRGGYQIGTKGSEVKVPTFDEALKLLIDMPLAKWRRPNAAGNFGLVSAVEWKRVMKSELDAL